jgi:hypothetical protein
VAEVDRTRGAPAARSDCQRISTTSRSASGPAWPYSSAPTCSGSRVDSGPRAVRAARFRIAEPHDAGPVEQMRVDPRDLRRDVRPQPIVRPDSWSISLNVVRSRSRRVPVSSDSMYSIIGGITSS